MSRNLLAVLLGITLMWGIAPLLTACGETASCWNDIKGRFTSCEDMRRDEIDRELDRREMERSR